MWPLELSPTNLKLEDVNSIECKDIACCMGDILGNLKKSDDRGSKVGGL